MSFASVFRLARVFGSLLLPAITLTALQPDQRVTQYAHTAWGQQDGRLPGVVYAMTQTRDGRLWVGTEFGLFSFDGVRFTPWKPPVGKQPPNQVIAALAPAPDGGLWIGTRTGLSYLKDQELRNYKTSNGASGPSVSSVLVDHAGTVWVGTVGFNSGGLCRVQADHLTCLTPADGYDGNGVLALFEDKAGNLWAGTVGGLYRRDSQGFRRYGPSKSIQAIAQDSDGAVIVPSSGGLLKLAKERLVDYVTGQTARPTHTLLSDSDGGLWNGTMGDGLIHHYQGRADRFTRVDGLSGNTIFGLFEDREHSIWVATERGLDRFREFPVITFSQGEGLSADTVQSVFAAKQGGVWLGTTDGLNRVFDGRIVTYNTRAGLPSTSIGSLIEDRTGTLWADSALGLAFTRGAGFQQLRLPGGQQIESVAAAAEDRDGALWFSDLKRGLIRVEGQRITKVIPWSQFDNNLAQALAADPVRGGLLIGFTPGGIADFGEGRATHWYTEADGLGSGVVNDIRFDSDGTAWIATDGGLSRLRNGSIATLTSSNGLPCQQIHSMIEADDRSIWMDTPCGLLRIIRSDLAAWSSDPRIKIQPTVFGAREGMYSHSRKSGYFRGAAKSNDGRLWFPTFEGVAVVDPLHLPQNRLPPPVEIGSILVDDVAQMIRPSMELPHISQELQIDYTAFSFVDPDQVRFKYKLEGFDSEWIDAAERRQALYPSLPPRDYRFRVIASNNDGIWNDAGAFVDFSVAPIYYQTAWFRFLAAASIAVLVWLAFQARVRQLEATVSLRYEERVKERMRIGREIHDTVLQYVSGLGLQLDGLSKVVTDPPSAKDDLRELRQETEVWLHEARESVWDLRCRGADEEDLQKAIRRIGERLTEGKEIQFRARDSGVRQKHKIDARIQRNLLRIVQEAIGNACSHGSATEIDVDISYLDGGQLLIQIRDNGRGFDLDTASRKPGHWGLTTMRERTDDIGAQLHIVTSLGQGARIEIRSPIAPTSDRLSHG